MAKAGPIAQRLKAYVRAYVKAEHGRASALARAIDRTPNWVTQYVDENAPEPRWADLDTAVAICRAIGVPLSTFIEGADVAAPRALTDAEIEGRQIAELWPALDEEARGILKRMMHFADKRRASPIRDESTAESPPADQEAGLRIAPAPHPRANRGRRG